MSPLVVELEVQKHSSSPANIKKKHCNPETNGQPNKEILKYVDAHFIWFSVCAQENNYGNYDFQSQKGALLGPFPICI